MSAPRADSQMSNSNVAIQSHLQHTTAVQNGNAESPGRVGPDAEKLGPGYGQLQRLEVQMPVAVSAFALVLATLSVFTRARE
jgi:hypothetical protein